MDNLYFQYCQKIVIFSKDKSKVLLCKRKGEADYDGVFSFIGGKMETGDVSIIESLKREKNEEVGSDFKIKIFTGYTSNYEFKKKSGDSMILPHYLAIYETGIINLNKQEYSEYQRVDIEKIDEFQPKIPTIPQAVQEMLRLEKMVNESEYILI